MPTYRGNQGNLLQHWVFCELMRIAAEYETHVNLVDAYSMAPMARAQRRPGRSGYLFDCVEASLPGLGSAYENAWQALATGSSGYPNTAAILDQIWPGTYSMLLCEIDADTARDLKAWGEEIKRNGRCQSLEIAENDWRGRLSQGVVTGVGLKLIAFDPNKFDRHGPPARSNPRPEHMYPRDLELAAAFASRMVGTTLLQLSTFSAKNGNSQDEVTAAVDSILSEAGFVQGADVRAGGNMMSLVYSRDVRWASQLGELSAAFTDWFRRVKSRCPKRS